MKASNYRPEIDGLRAIAVLAVIIFHAGVEQMEGGFIGVDIFYVISGYLITSILVNSLEKNDFKFKTFYIRRIKRLLPAALSMVGATVVIGFFFLTPDNYIELVKSAIYSNLFAANIWFMNNSGYFDQSTQIAPLVHMWSLSVEEQFYMIFPLMLFGAHRFLGIKGVRSLVALMITSSLLLSVLFSTKYPDFSFYMLPTRAWELGMGACVALIPFNVIKNRTLANTLSLSGAALLIYSLAFISHNDIFPGYLGLVPTMGTALIILSLSSHKNLLKDLLTLKPIGFIGQISYSAYLWHWPLIVYYRIYINQRDFFLHEMLMLIATSIGFGYLSWKFIEEKFRYKSYTFSTVSLTAISATLLIIGLSGIVYKLNGFPGRIDSSAIAITDDNLMWNFKCTERLALFSEIDETYCVVGLPWQHSKNKGLVWGDSHSLHMAQLLHHEAIQNNASFVIAPTKCPPYLNYQHVSSNYPKYPTFTDDCTFRNQLATKWLNSSSEVDLVVMASAWSGHVRMLYTKEAPENNSNRKQSSEIGSQLSLNALRELIPQIQSKQILIIGDVPRPNKILNECASVSKLGILLREKCDESTYKYLDAKEIALWHQHSDNALRTISDEFENVTTLIPGDSLCDDTKCKTYVNDELIYKDGNHIRRNLSPDSVDALSRLLRLQDNLSKIWGN